MKITIIYDNEAYDKGLIPKWGFSCLIKQKGRQILFDTGGQAKILKNNMQKLNIDKNEIKNIFISHPHWDHVGGFQEVIRNNNDIDVYIPPACQKFKPKISSAFTNYCKSENVNNVVNAQKIHDDLYSTGELENIEQSLVVSTEKGLVVIVGCSHPGVGKILDVASRFGDIYGLVGGLHGFNNYNRLTGLELICATHCTQNIKEIKSRYPFQFKKGGAGQTIDI